MSTQLELASPFDALMRVNDAGDEYWSARDLMPLLGYSKWQRFEEALERAKISAANTGVNTANAFAQVIQVTGAGNLGDLRRYDYHLSRYACYLTAMNGDPRKSEIAAAQTYFAVKTREAETAPAKPMTELEMAQQYVAALQREAEMAARVKQLEAPAKAWDVMVSAGTDYGVGDAAKVLSRDPQIRIGRDRLFDYMAELGWCFRDPSDKNWRPYQKAVDAGRLRERINAGLRLSTSQGRYVSLPPTMRVTVKGLADLHKRLGGTSEVQQLVEGARA